MATKNTKELIIEKASELFLTKNYEAVSINEISKVCGLTKGALYHHFVNKEDLFNDVINKFISDAKIEIGANSQNVKQFIKTSLKSTNDLLTKLMGAGHESIPVNIASLAVEAKRHSPHFTNQMLDYLNQSVNQWKQALTKSIEEKNIRADIDVDTFATLFFQIELSIFSNIILFDNFKKAVKQMQVQYQELYKVISI
ncbi:TetR/AcrR family transcriptional regulator [Geofilum sp. OHC36d9]|uniref:TetR/AcrR family transcriptional regulator n=1 Tax=Geofilum sp. OHC36d9 TaxID=3458413 RepID=UPI004033F878